MRNPPAKQGWDLKPATEGSLHPTDNSASLAGRRVLVVEDEALVSLLIEQILDDLGCHVMGPAMRVSEALALLEREAVPDFALLDVNVGGEQVFPIAEALDQAGVPFAFSTGYGEVGLPPDWRGRPTLRKPYTQEDVVAALNLLAAVATTSGAA